MTPPRAQVPLHKLIGLSDCMAFVYWPLLPPWTETLRCYSGHTVPSQADFLAREPLGKPGIIFGKN